MRKNASAATRAAEAQLKRERAEGERQTLLADFNAATPAEREQIAAMVAIGVETSLDHIMAAFKKQPGGDYWAKLEESMWAWQYWRQHSGTERLLIAFGMRDIGIGKWMEHLAAQHRPEQA